MRTEVLTDSFDKDRWIGTEAVVEDEVCLNAVRKMAAMLDGDPDTFAEGSVMPPHWYSMLFTPNARRSEIGHDGHPRKGAFLPPIPLPRRMFVGREVHFLSDLRVGDRAQKQSTIREITDKSGRSGPLVFVTVRHTILVNNSPAIIEDQKIVYRSAAPPSENLATKHEPAPEQADWSEEDEFDPVLVFRYSALTWNGHKIHYDSDYAQNTEGYPRRVMNGALTVHMLIDAALRRASGRLRGLRARLAKPMFVGDRARFAGRTTSSGMAAWVTNTEGALTATVELDFADER